MSLERDVRPSASASASIASSERWIRRVDGAPGGASSCAVPRSEGVVEEAPGACKDVAEVVEAADRAGLAHTVARVEPLICVKG